ncbi:MULTISPECIES: FAD-dependent oxidoreductase [Actinomadura]|uniref:Predicted flavoprotein CzcO associated with the cation diffusion facilitator CzcD n=1 Tax=Actinomadura madurae TaxID=1993 RepID=A0A1I5UC14_9ACTN|nr:FAD-dependent oxidoreductase [Actinomadura madurae]SFP92782.1 Predicted flavoprotein CzcO associated with the cation diffusion facilitator CzcD [Actinomadura madurae]SPT51920.1 dihydrolipoamide dehydrogenase [Actinomadura madurae]
MSDSACDVVIAGAGPYGLSTAAHLRYLGLDVRVIGEPMRFWDANMPEGMYLKSEPFASSLGAPQEGLRFIDRHRGWRVGHPIPLETFVEYGRWFAAEAVSGTEDAEVVSVGRGGRGGFAVALSTGERIAARTVVVAVGVGPFAHIPDELEGMPSWLVSHSSAHSDLGLFAGKDVAVVGAGQSALETAVLLADAGAHPHLLARRRELDWNTVPEERRSRRSVLLEGPRSGLGTGYRTWLWAERPGIVRYLPERTRRKIVRETLPPAGAWWLRDRLDDRIRVSTGRHLSKAVELDDGVALTTVDRNGRRLVTEAEHVIAATGFVPDVERLPLLAPELRARIRTRAGAPVLSRDFEASVPGLYFAGLAAALTFGPVMRFVHGAGFAAGRIAHHISRRGPRPSMPPVRAESVPEADVPRR